MDPAEIAAAEAAAAAKVASDKTAADAAEAAKAAAAKAAKTPEQLAQEVEELRTSLKKAEDDKATLLKETMARKTKLKEADDTNTETKTKLELALASINELFGENVGLDGLTAAVADRKAKQEEALRKTGDFDALKARLIEEHKKELASINGKSAQEIGTTKKELESANAEIRRLLVSNSFASSPFIKDELNLTPGKAERLYGENFKVETVEGRRVIKAYIGDAPLVDGEGKSKSFDLALKEIIDADPEKESLFKAKGKPGAGSGIENQGNGGLTPKRLSGTAAIAAGLKALKAA